MIDSPIETLITTPCSVLKKLPDEEKLIVAERVAEYYQAQGFPYYVLGDTEKAKIIDKLTKFDVGLLDVGNNEIQQNMLGLNFVNSYHPQMWDVMCAGNKRTPVAVFNDTELLTKAIYKRINLSDTKLQPFNIRKSLRIFGGYSVSNFRPTVAKYIYETYGVPNGRVLDPCAGYGGRLFAAMVSGMDYIGVDPDARQIAGNEKMAADIIRLSDGHCTRPLLIDKPFEDLDLVYEYDLVFTSPPYFDKEKYSYEPSQSFIRYPKYDVWVARFLTALIKKSYGALKPGRVFAINVAGDQLAADTVRIGTDVFGTAPEVKWMRLSKLLGKGVDKHSTKFKLEGIYIWRKRGN